MQAGETEVPTQSISIVYKDTDTNEDVPLTAEVPATKIVATVPEAARSLDPLIVAQGLDIQQTWQVIEGQLAVGDAVTRQLEISVTGTSALFVPPLLENSKPIDGNTEGDPPIAAFIGYPEDPVVTESFERGVMSGTRTEQVSYIAQSGGGGMFPEIVLDWYNLDSGTIETIKLEGLSVDVAIPPQTRAPINPDAARRMALTIIVFAGVVWAGFRFLWPLAKPRLLSARAIWRGSAFAAHRTALQVASERDLRGLLAALDQLAARGHTSDLEVREALEALTRKLYRDGNEAKAEWAAVERALRRDRPAIFGRNSKAADLPNLNPFA